MVSQVSKEALNALKQEMRRVPGGHFGTHIMNRLKNENPQYAFISDGFLEAFGSKFGREGRVMVRDVIAICYRILELSERYPDKALLLSRTLLSDPSLESTNEAAAQAEKETQDILKRFMLH